MEPSAARSFPALGKESPTLALGPPTPLRQGTRGIGQASVGGVGAEVVGQSYAFAPGPAAASPGPIRRRRGALRRRPSACPEIVNRNSKTARSAWITALVFLLACFLPAFGGWDMMKGGYAMILLSGFACLAAVITALIYGSRSRQAEALLSGTGGFMAEWSIPPELWGEILQRQFEEEKSAKRILLGIVWFFCLTIGAGFILYDPKPGLWVAAVLGLLMVVTGLAASLTPGARLRRLRRTEARVRLGRECVMLGDELHSWSLVGSWLQGADLEMEGDRHWLRVRYAFLTRAGVQEEQVLLPVPSAEIPQAERAVAAWNQRKRAPAAKED